MPSMLTFPLCSKQLPRKMPPWKGVTRGNWKISPHRKHIFPTLVLLSHFDFTKIFWYQKKFFSSFNLKHYAKCLALSVKSWLTGKKTEVHCISYFYANRDLFIWWTGFVGAGNGNGIGRAQKGGKLCWPTSFHAGCICRCIPRKTPRYPNPFSMFSPAFLPRLPLSFT